MGEQAATRSGALWVPLSAMARSCLCVEYFVSNHLGLP